MEHEHESINGRSTENVVSIKDMHQIENEEEQLQYNVLDRPPFLLIISLALQNILTVVTSVMGFSAILSDILCVETSDPIRARIFSTTLVLSGFGTILQTNFGVRLPIFQGPAYAYIPPLLALSRLDDWKCDAVTSSLTSNESQLFDARQVMFDNQTLNTKYEKLNLLSGSLVLSSFIEFLAGVTGFTGQFVRFISPVTIAVTIATIGFSVIDFTIEYSQRFWGTSMLTAGLSFLFIFYLNNMQVRLPPFTKNAKRSKIFQNYPILLALCIGWVVSYILTVSGYFTEDSQAKQFLARTDAKNEMIDSTPWITIPYPGQYGYPKFHAPTFFGFTVGVISSIIESVGDYFAAASICGTGRPPQHAVNRGIMSEGFTGIVSGFMGAGNATTSYSNHIALIGVTKVASRIVLTAAGVITIVLAMLGKVAAVLAAIPDPVIGGSFFVGVAIMISLGLTTMQKVRLNTRNTLIFGTAIGLGQLLPRWIAQSPNAINTGNYDVDQCLKVILGTEIFVAALVAALLDNTIPGTHKERGMEHLDHGAKYVTPDHQDEKSNEIFEFPLLRNILRKQRNIIRYIPFLPTPYENLAPKSESVAPEDVNSK